MLINILLVIELLVGVALAGVVLLQRSEGGALGMGGGPSGFMTARGAGDFLTRVTWILGAVFFSLALLLTILQGRMHGGSSVVDRIKVDAIDPNALVQTRPTTAPAAGQPAGQRATTPDAAPAPLQAPTPTVRNPFLDGASAPAPTAPPTK
jgi:preprotein translocase subunit SecG